jgi:penicillin-binding protein 1A
MSLLKKMYVILIAVLCLLAVFAGAMGYLLYHTDIDFTALERYNPGKATVLLDCHGKEWARFALDKRKEIRIEDLPKHLIQAFLAAEDWDFYTHFGLSLKGIVRSFLVNVYHWRVKQGASTITQQLVRLLFFDHNRTLSRKLKEQFMALLVELRFSKDQILQAYLNHVYFSCGIYGVEAAAQRFWHKSASEVTLDEAAALAGIMRSPRTYSPLLHPDATERRRNVVLGQMLRLEFITQEEYNDATGTALYVKPAQSRAVGLHAKEYVRRKLEQIVGDTLYTGGYLVQTTVDLEIQEKAEKIFSEHISQIRKKIHPEIDGGLLTIEVGTGKIRALLGGADFESSKFNRAFQARRQLGSVFKPLIFAAAMQQGMRFSDVFVDEPLEIIDAYGAAWRPQNYDLRFNGPITLAYALSRSNNIVSIKTFLQVGADAVIKLAEKCRLSGPFHRYASLSLGCVDTTLKEAVGMFNIFAHHGTYVEPYIIAWVKDAWGSRVYKHKPEEEPVLSPYISGQVLKVMGLGLDRVRALIPQKWLDSQAASKTGTTNDHRTCWFLGSTPELTTGVYVGCDDNRSMGVNIYPLHTAFPIWMGLHREITTSKKVFDFDSRLKEIEIDERTGKIVPQANKKSSIKILV